ELELNTEELKRKRIQIFLSFLIFLIFLCLVLIRIDLGTPNRLWAGSLLISFFFLCGIIYLWYTAHTNVRYKLEEEDSVIVEDRSTLNRFLETAQFAATAAKAAMLKQADEQLSESQQVEKTATEKAVSAPLPVKEQVPTKIKPTIEEKKEVLHEKIDADKSKVQEAKQLNTPQGLQKGLQQVIQNIQSAAASL